MRRDGRSQAQAAWEEYGMTDDPQFVEKVRAYVAAARADGWTWKKRYASEPEHWGAELDRSGFKIVALSRGDDTKPFSGGYKYQASIHIWGPDGLAIKPPDTYDWAAIQAGVTQCNLCNKTGVKTFRYSFAGRCCHECIPAARAEHERPGWNS